MAGGNARIVGALKDLLMALRDACRKTDKAFSDFDRGIMSVGLCVAAIDGSVTDSELRFLSDFVASCPDGRNGLIRSRAQVDEVVKIAGGLALMARMSLYSEEDRLRSFFKAVGLCLPKGFSGTTREELRYAFICWTALALTDGVFSETEQKAIRLLQAEFDRESALKRQDDIFISRQVAALTQDYDKTLSELSGPRPQTLLGEDFIFQAVEMLRQKGVIATAAEGTCRDE